VVHFVEATKINVIAEVEEQPVVEDEGSNDEQEEDESEGVDEGTTCEGEEGEQGRVTQGRVDEGEQIAAIVEQWRWKMKKWFWWKLKGMILVKNNDI
jgi:hypothetical protein